MIPQSNATLLEQLKLYGVGHRGYDDDLFADEKPPPKFGIYDEDDENLCHEVVKSVCHIPGCTFTAESLLDFENHYNTSHRYSCSQCKKILPSPHLLDLHIQESHDSFFAVLATRKPSYCCYIEECKEKFTNAEERLDHCVNVHRLPKDYRFDRVQLKLPRGKKNKNKQTKEGGMEVDCSNTSTQHAELRKEPKKFSFVNSKQKAFTKYTGKKFTDEDRENKDNKHVNIDTAMEELKESLPS